LASGIVARSNPRWRGRGLGYYKDIIQEAAALWESLSQNHAFVDGNKRVAVTVTAAFLTVNGYKLEFNDMDAYAFLIDLYESGRMRFQELEIWLRQRSRLVVSRHD
jgi:death-on-curing protein